MKPTTRVTLTGAGHDHGKGSVKGRREEDRRVEAKATMVLLSSRARELLRDAQPLLERRKNDMEAALKLKDEMGKVLLDPAAPCLLGERFRLGGGDETSNLYSALSDCKRSLEQRIIEMKPRC